MLLALEKPGFTQQARAISVISIQVGIFLITYSYICHDTKGLIKCFFYVYYLFKIFSAMKMPTSF